MTTSTTRPPPGDGSAHPVQASEQYGAATFAAMLMLLAGTLHLLEGLVALVNEDFYVVKDAQPFELDLRAWGWVHLLFGLAVGLAGAGLLAGVRWARAAATVLAAASVLVNALWLPHYPLWSAIVIGLDVFVLWALFTRRETTAGRSAGRGTR